jgi:hypothetical protein
MSKRVEGIEIRHERRCPAGEDGRRCRCRLWLVGARAGAVRRRSGDTYEPGAVRCYEQAMPVLPSSEGSASPTCAGPPSTTSSRRDGRG